MLQDYSKSPDDSFWKFFPSKPLPVKPETEIDIDKLESEVLSMKDKMTIHQLERSLKAVNYLRYGAPSFQTEKLPGCFVKTRQCSVKQALSEETVTLRDCQRLVGRMNDISQMCPLLKAFRRPVIDLLAGIPSDASKDLPIKVTREAKDSQAHSQAPDVETLLSASSAL